MTEAMASRHPFLAAFAGPAGPSPRAEPAWFGELRRAALARFEEVGFPSPRDEAWKNTNVEAIASGQFGPAGAAGPGPTAGALARVAGPALGGPRLVLVDGRWSGNGHTAAPVAGLWAGDLEQALATMPEALEPHFLRHDPRDLPPFAALNTALHAGGAVLRVAAGVALDRPIEILHVSTGHGAPRATFPRTFVLAGRGSRCRIVETWCGLGADPYLTVSFCDVVVEAGADVEHYRLQLESPAALHVAHLATRQLADSRYTAHTVHLGARLARHDVVSVLDGPGTGCRLNGLYLTRGHQHVDNQTLLDHAAPHGSSRELYKGILDGESRAIFNGKIVVRPGAQRTDAKQSNQNLLLSAQALAHTRPQLEIRADDVKCTHGATVGRLDAQAIFYLRSRGLPREQAERLLTAAFAGEVLELMDIEPLREHLTGLVATRLADAATAGTR